MLPTAASGLRYWGGMRMFLVMFWSSGSFTKMVYHEGVGVPIKHGDYVTVRYSGIWSAVEDDALGIQ